MIVSHKIEYVNVDALYDRLLTYRVFLTRESVLGDEPFALDGFFGRDDKFVIGSRPDGVQCLTLLSNIAPFSRDGCPLLIGSKVVFSDRPCRVIAYHPRNLMLVKISLLRCKSPIRHMFADVSSLAFEGGC